MDDKFDWNQMKIKRPSIERMDNLLGWQHFVLELTSEDNKAALEAYGREKMREGMQRAADISLRVNLTASMTGGRNRRGCPSASPGNSSASWA